MMAAQQTNMSWVKELEAIGANAKAALRSLILSTAETRSHALKLCAQKLRSSKDAILKANALDVARGQTTLSKAMIDRLTLTADRIDAIAKGLDDVAAQPDPIGKIQEEWTRPNGLKIQRVSVPLGVIGMIYESRPNVTAEAASIALRGGNAIILRCGSDCFESSKAIANAMQEGLAEAGLPKYAVQLVPTTDRNAVGALLSMTRYVDVIVPRGGRELIERVERESKIPLLRQYEGVNHIYIDAKADAEKAKAVIQNAKMRRTSICGAAECLLFETSTLVTIAAPVIKNLLDAGCEVRGDDAIAALDARVKKAEASDWGKEFLEPIIAARVLGSMKDAIEHIATYSSNHTDCILTENKATADMFCAQVDSAIVMVNASTQFADGGEFGFGGEVGIATGRFHARGPIGAAQLTSYKYIVLGNGQTRP
ncbi:MAG: glutamate-5-semialdehyde dehydrogenase [Alphaproteobacteria bacterium]|nr:glutamate-5-semialdehyde dehydrogenase [Alphaproteobacteria bacterium]